MLTMEDKGEELALKARHKDANNSMAIGIDLVKKGEADAFVTAGNTGAAMLTALFRLGRMRGVDRPALAPSFPTATGSSVVIDIGANPDCKPENLLQFAIMGSVYAEKVRGVKPQGYWYQWRRGGQGNELSDDHALLKSDELLRQCRRQRSDRRSGDAVTDGFTGTLLKDLRRWLNLSWITLDGYQGWAAGITRRRLVRPALEKSRYCWIRVNTALLLLGEWAGAIDMVDRFLQ
jgi:hypothetical protein